MAPSSIAINFFFFFLNLEKNVSLGKLNNLFTIFRENNVASCTCLKNIFFPRNFVGFELRKCVQSDKYGDP